MLIGRAVTGLDVR